MITFIHTISVIYVLFQCVSKIDVRSSNVTFKCIINYFYLDLLFFSSLYIYIFLLLAINRDQQPFDSSGEKEMKKCALKLTVNVPYRHLLEDAMYLI